MQNLAYNDFYFIIQIFESNQLDASVDIIIKQCLYIAYVKG